MSGSLMVVWTIASTWAAIQPHAREESLRAAVRERLPVPAGWPLHHVLVLDCHGLMSALLVPEEQTAAATEAFPAPPSHE